MSYATILLIISNLLIKVTCAGAGKTSAFIYTAEKTKQNTLFITPYNALCFDLRKKGHNAITLHKLL
jgi:superfamily II DNA or RNA helicase